jgi:hypothetical protein
MTNCSREVEGLLHECFFYNFLVIDQEVDTLIRQIGCETVELFGGKNSQNQY